MLLQFKPPPRWNGSLYLGKWSSQSRVPISAHFPPHGKGAGGLSPGCIAGRCTHCVPPAQLAVNGHCLQLQQAGQGPQKLLMEVPCSSSLFSFTKCLLVFLLSQKRLHNHGRVRSTKAHRTSKQSVFFQ